MCCHGYRGQEASRNAEELLKAEEEEKKLIEKKKNKNRKVSTAINIPTPLLFH